MCEIVEKQVEMVVGGKKLKIDKCLVNIVQALDAHGIGIVSSCCGHDIYDGYIWIKDNGKNIILRLATIEEYENEIAPMARKIYANRKKS